ncbi:hypothetical protein EAG_16068 [Camponotus floridanus]|uniref:C2H2-type domain-containing protein n=1 Tax=Camponotus floridanus TaxID=104421 RepID=E2A2E8_CAMFO|nr:hypothetical protein EAG_16068 [Camponotus floridanus]
MCQWKWNYFTLESLSKVECSLCNKVYKPRLCITEHLTNHINENKEKDPEHKKTYLEYKSSRDRTRVERKEFKWDSIYKITSSNLILKPNVQCSYCKVDIPTPRDGTPFLRAPEGLSEHLKNDHNIEFQNWKAFRRWIREKATTDYGYNIHYQRENEVIKVHRCEACQTDIKAKNAIMFVKHLIDKHHQKIKHFPPDIIPKELLLDFDPDDKFEDIPACIENPVDKSDDVPTGTKDPANYSWEVINISSTSIITQPLCDPSHSGQSGSSQPSQSSQSSQSAGTSKKSPSKRKRSSSHQTKEHPSKRKKDSST